MFYQINEALHCSS